MHVYVRGIIVERQKSLKCDSSRPAALSVKYGVEQWALSKYGCTSVLAWSVVSLIRRSRSNFPTTTTTTTTTAKAYQKWEKLSQWTFSIFMLSISQCQCPVSACLPSVLCSVCPCFELAERIILKQRIPERKCNFGLASIQF
ncbi:hypothetical protein T4B_13718 [Trichinella pseudospiralis]|uniref:Uncharacterized protein n=1 Tax=Trichinella pseudospiralis TaxID=6337 RepID=A0A0V1IQX9_TRIPS|nr:hypothetical protein T4B_13718 [Trichinella pseudospiralis]